MNLTTNTQKTYTVEVYNWNTEVFELSESLYIDSNEQIIDGSTNETVDEYYLMDELIYECSSDTQFDDILYLCVKDENDEIIYETESFNLINNSDLTATNTFNSYNKDNWTYKIKCDDTFDIDKLEVHSDTSVSYDGEEFYYLDCDGTGKGSDYNIQSEKEYKKTKKKIVPEAPKVEVSPEETKEKPISVMSVFNGIGAFSESLMQLDIDYDMKMVCEIDEAANETFYANNEYDKARHTDDINVLLDEVEENLDLDILCMTPECTSFSTQGSRKGFDSVSGNLTKVAIELFQKVQPKVLLLENVFSMTHHEKYIHTYKRKDGTTFETYKKLSKKEFAKTDLEYMGQHELYLKSKINPDFKNTIGRTFSITEQLFLEKNGKDYNFYWKKMSPNHYGAPQHRQRLILVGIRKDLDKGFQFPKEKDLEFTVADILEKDKSRIDEKLYFKTDLELTLKNQKKRIGEIHTYGNYEDIKFDTDSRVSYPYVAPAVLTGNSNKFFIDGKVRKLTQFENKLLMGFNSNFKFVGEEQDINRQIGNTVSPFIYKPVIEKILEYVDFEAVEKPKSKRGRKSKTTVISNDHISLSKEITNKPDENYLNLTQERFNEYKKHLEDGGTISVAITKYKSLKDKRDKKVECKYITPITDLKQLGFRDKKNGIYRCKITGKKSQLKKIGKRDVLNSRNGGKNQFAEQLNLGIEKLKTLNHKTVVDCFAGAGGFTLKNIEKMKFQKYIMNEFDFYQYNVFLAVKKNPQKVIEVFNKHNSEFLSLINEEHLLYEKEYVKNKYKSKSKEYYQRKALREKHIKLKRYYEKTVHLLEDKTQDIYTLAGLYVFVMNRTFNGIFEYKNEEQTIIDETSFNWHLNPKNKVHMIKHWSWILNKYNVELTNEDIFKLLPKIDSDSTLYLDPVYFESGRGADYGSNWSNKEQIKLLEDTKRFHRVLYSNENCQELFDLKIDTYFEDHITFKRQNKLGRVDKAVGGEFLGFRNKPLLQIKSANNTYLKAVNNINQNKLAA